MKLKSWKTHTLELHHNFLTFKYCNFLEISLKHSIILIRLTCWQNTDVHEIFLLLFVFNPHHNKFITFFEYWKLDLIQTKRIFQGNDERVIIARFFWSFDSRWIFPYVRCDRYRRKNSFSAILYLLIYFFCRYTNDTVR